MTAVTTVCRSIDGARHTMLADHSTANRMAIGMRLEWGFVTTPQNCTNRCLTASQGQGQRI